MTMRELRVFKMYHVLAYRDLVVVVLVVEVVVVVV